MKNFAVIINNLNYIFSHIPYNGDFKYIIFIKTNNIKVF